jgi:hypothetical protein
VVVPSPYVDHINPTGGTVDGNLYGGYDGNPDEGVLGEIYVSVATDSIAHR